MAQIIGLRDWNPEGTLSSARGAGKNASPTEIGQVISLITGLVGQGQQKKKDQQFRTAIKQEMGIDVPQGVDAAKLYDTIMTEKIKAQADPEKQMFNRMFGGMGGTPPTMPNDNAMPGTTPAIPQAPQIDQGQLMRGMMSKKFGVPYEQMMTPEEKKTAEDVKMTQSPSYQEKKAKRTEDLLSTLGQNKVQREMIASAQEATPRIPTGLGGKLQMWWNKMFDPNNPSMADWQKVKMVLTDAQLLNTAKTKGAISDREMALFSRAAANDDIASISAMGPVFNKLLRFIETDENAKIGTFGKLYGEDVNLWPEVQERGQQMPTPGMANKVGKYTLVQ
jgi:hypothetical protein